MKNDNKLSIEERELQELIAKKSAVGESIREMLMAKWGYERDAQVVDRASTEAFFSRPEITSETSNDEESSDVLPRNDIISVYTRNINRLKKTKGVFWKRNGAFYAVEMDKESLDIYGYLIQTIYLTAQNLWDTMDVDRLLHGQREDTFIEEERETPYLEVDPRVRRRARRQYCLALCNYSVERADEFLRVTSNADLAARLHNFCWVYARRRLSEDYEEESFRGDGTNCCFSLSHQMEHVISIKINGEITTEYTVAAENGQEVTLTECPKEGDVIRIKYRPIARQHNNLPRYRRHQIDTLYELLYGGQQRNRAEGIINLIFADADNISDSEENLQFLRLIKYRLLTTYVDYWNMDDTSGIQTLWRFLRYFILTEQKDGEYGKGSMKVNCRKIKEELKETQKILQRIEKNHQEYKDDEGKPAEANTRYLRVKHQEIEDEKISLSDQTVNNIYERVSEQNAFVHNVIISTLVGYSVDIVRDDSQLRHLKNRVIDSYIQLWMDDYQTCLDDTICRLIWLYVLIERMNNNIVMSDGAAYEKAKDKLQHQNVRIDSLVMDEEIKCFIDQVYRDCRSYLMNLSNDKDVMYRIISNANRFAFESISVIGTMEVN